MLALRSDNHMASVQRGQFTYAGAMDSSFDEYAEEIRVMPLARVVPLLYTHAPDHTGYDSAPFVGTVGVFDSHAALVAPLGAYPTQYGGNLPVTQQPKVQTPDPWDAPELT